MLLRVLLSIPDVGQIDAFVEPWRRVFSHSPLLSTVVLFGHLAGLLAAGGLTVASDRATLRLDPTDDVERRRHLADLARLQAPMWSMLGIALLSGALLFFADVEAFAASRIFWTKMALVALLVANGVFTARLDTALQRDARSGSGFARSPGDLRRWRRRRVGAMASAVLWFGLVLVGTALASH